ncbi:hypothetical protein D3C76_1863690 [compost metagenome]
MLQALGVVDVKLPGGETGAGQVFNVFGFTGGGPNVVAGIAKGFGQGAADAAGTTGDQDGGHGAGLCSE